MKFIVTCFFISSFSLAQELHPIIAFDSLGYPTKIWMDIIYKRYNYNDSTTLNIISSTKDSSWIKNIYQAIPRWKKILPKLQKPFFNVSLSDTIYIVIGNQLADDAFTHGNNTICFDIQQLSEYGKGESEENKERIDRIFSHEYIHLLHKSWRKDKIIITTQWEKILLECVNEGLGNYYSLSQKWKIDTQGKIPEITKNTLKKLEPIFVEKFCFAFHHQNFDDSLFNKLSKGKFEEKWGALPVALWLDRETHSDSQLLRQWIEKGLDGVLYLADKYLEEPYRSKLRECRK